MTSKICYSVGYRHFIASSKYYCPFCHDFIIALNSVHSCPGYFDYLKEQEFEAHLYDIVEKVIDNKLVEEVPKFSPKVQKVVI